MDLRQARDLMTADPATLPGTMTAGDALRFFAEEARHRSSPVVDGEGGLRGLVSRSDALGWRVSDVPADGTPAALVSDAAQPVAYHGTPAGQVAPMLVHRSEWPHGKRGGGRKGST